jgi:hypothetical protein
VQYDSAIHTRLYDCRLTKQFTSETDIILPFFMWLMYLSFACGMHLSPRECTQVFVSRTCDNDGNALVRNGVMAMHAEEADAIGAPNHDS